MKLGEIVRFREPLPDEDPEQRYVVVETKGDRLDVSPVGAYWDALRIRPVQTVKAEDVCSAQS